MNTSRYLIWSFEHVAWWRPGQFGYSKEIKEAGNYSYKDALEICRGANAHRLPRGQFPNEAMVPVTMAEVVQIWEL